MLMGITRIQCMCVCACVRALGGGFGVRSSKGLIEVLPWVIKLRLVVGSRLWKSRQM